MVVDNDSAFGFRRIIVARWWDEADRYFSCAARLDEQDVALTDAFVEACTSALPLWIP